MKVCDGLRLPLKIHFVLQTVFLLAGLRQTKPQISLNMSDFIFLASKQNFKFSHQKQFLEAPLMLCVEKCMGKCIIEVILLRIVNCCVGDII